MALALLLPLLFVSRLPSGADSVVDAIFARQSEMARAITDVSYDGNYTYIEQDNRAGSIRETRCLRRVYMKGFSRQRFDVRWVRTDGRELHGRELRRAVKELASRGAVAGNTRMPFMIETRDEYDYILQGETDWQGRPAWLVEFEPRKKTDRHIRGTATVLKENATVVRLDFRPVRLPFVVPHMRLVLDYGLVQDYWLPLRFTMDMDLKLKVFVSVLDRHIEIEDVYTDHLFNAGLDDAFFSRRIAYPE